MKIADFFLLVPLEYLESVKTADFLLVPLDYLESALLQEELLALL